MNKDNPSKKYLENLNYYKQMHLEGYKLIDGRKRNPKDSYDGKSTLVYAKLIRNIIIKNKINSLLDYGCGKGFYYENTTDQYGIQNMTLRDFWNINIDLYDPCVEENSSIDEDKKYDLIISIDVLEHIPSNDIDWVLKKIFNKANKYVFLNVACYPAVALLPNGENAHINVNEPQWWHEKILNIKKSNSFLKIICICTKKENDKITYFPLQYDDKLTNYMKR